MKFSALRSALLSLLTGATVFAPAGANAMFKMVTPPPAVKAIFAANPTVMQGIKFFEGPGNLTGVFVSLGDGSRPSIMYVTPDGKTTIAGQAIDIKSKRNLTAEAAVQFAPQSTLGKTGAEIIKATPLLAGASTSSNDDPVPTEAATPDALSHLNFVETGTGDRVIYVFVDALCMHCKTAYDDIRAWQKKGGKARVRWVPISLGSDKASTLAAYALGGKGELALQGMFRQQADGKATERLAKGAVALETNMAFSQDTIPMTATPTFVYVDGGKVVAKAGYAGLISMSSPTQR